MNKIETNEEQVLTFYKNIVGLGPNKKTDEYTLYTDRPGAMREFNAALATKVQTLVLKSIAIGIILGLVIALFVRSAHAETITNQEQIKRSIASAALAVNIDPSTAIAIAFVESSFNPKAKGKLGEIGLFQMRPEMFSIKKNTAVTKQINLAVQHFVLLKKRCGSAWPTCHNYGVTGAKRLKDPRKTAYFLKVQAAKKLFRAYSTTTYIVSN